MLADLEASIITTERYWVVNDDIKKAFDSVPIKIAATTFGKQIADEPTMHLIETILRGENPEEEVGIPQGCALSPLALNMMLTPALDEPLDAAHPANTHWRYADNLIGIFSNATEARAYSQQLQDHLRETGMELKYHAQPINLQRQGANVQILGYRIRLGDDRKFEYELLPNEWKRLRSAIEEASQSPNPTRKIRELISGWLAAHAPVLADADIRQEILTKLYRMAAQEGILELPSMEQMQEEVEKAVDQWNIMRRQALERHRLSQTPQEEVEEAEIGANQTRCSSSTSLSVPDEDCSTRSRDEVRLPPQNAGVEAIACLRAGRLSVFRMAIHILRPPSRPSRTPARRGRQPRQSRCRDPPKLSGRNITSRVVLVAKSHLHCRRC